MKLKIPQTIIQHLYDHALQVSPVEACGYLTGQNNTVHEHFEMTNVDQSEDHYTLDPEEQFSILKKARQKGHKILAVYHSHPKTPARPSEEDIKLAYDPSIIYMIISLKDGTKTMNAYQIKNQKVTLIPLEIISHDSVIVT